MQSFKKFVEENIVGTIDESAGLSRILQKLKEDIPFLSISAFRKDKKLQQNRKDNNSLMETIRKEFGNIGAYKMIGHWKECSVPLKDGEKISDCKGTVTDTLEESWLIPFPKDTDVEKINSVAQKLSKKYFQDGYIIREKTDVLMKNKFGEVWDNLGKADENSFKTGFKKMKDMQGYSELKKKRRKGTLINIVFEDVYIVIPKPCNSSKMIFNKRNILY